MSEQWQTSLNEQIVEMHRLAIEAGLYDAADWIKERVRFEMREAMRSNERGGGAA